MPEIDRRNFLKLVGVGTGTAAVTACSELPEKLIPYVVQPEEITPGLAVIYASTCQECPAGCGLHVRTREGRPIKLEGNPDHPVNRGALCARGQAGIGRTYLPDRYPGPMQRQPDGELAPIRWEDAHRLLGRKLREAGGGARVLGGETGPTLSALIDQWISATGVSGRVVYEPFDYAQLRQASLAVFGVAGRPRFDLSRADFIIDFGSDFLESWISPPEHARQFAQSRSMRQHSDGGAFFVYVGPRLSLTAGNSDEWLPAKPGTEGILALGIAHAVLDRAGESDATLPSTELLEGILDPSKRIDPQYVTYLVETTEGRLLTGLLVKKDANEVVIKDAQNKVIRVPSNQIEQLVPQRRSLMPDLLLRDMTAEQVADLLAYLGSLK